MTKRILQFIGGSARLALGGGVAYHVWMGFLTLLVLSGALAYWRQLDTGLILTNMRDQVSWAFYIGNFTFLVGVAAAAVLLVIPAYVYHWKPIREIAIFGELLAISAIVMCLLFVTVDVGRPDRVWELIPGLGKLNVPSSLLGWDVLVLNGYLMLNLVIVLHFLYAAYHRQPYNKDFVVPLLLLSIPAAVSIHTVTAFVYNGMASRPFWNASILAPRFIASTAFSIVPCAVRKTTGSSCPASLNRRSTPIPSSSGIWRSSSTRSIPPASMASSAAKPLAAVTTS